jgi:tripartite-type tricarboxylate transporter receptor subunit TctC
MKKPIFALIGLCASALVASTVFAADPYPVRPVQIVVPYSAGGGTDLAARVMAEAIEKYLGKPMVVKNLPGGGGAIGTSAVAHAAPDGYTLGMGAQGPLAMLPHYGGIDYTVNDFDFLALMGRNLIVIAVGKNAPFQDAKSFLAYAKANPGKLSIGNSGAGGAVHIAVEGLAAAAHIKVKSMPFGGGAPAITNCIGGHIEAVAAHPPELINHVQAGNLKPIMVLEDSRIKQFPDTPTAKEMGIDFTWAAWKGIVAPKGLPEPVKAKLDEALQKVFHDAEFLKKMSDLGEYIDFMPSAKFKALVMKDSAGAESVIRSLGMYGMNNKK